MAMLDCRQTPQAVRDFSECSGCEVGGESAFPLVADSHDRKAKTTGGADESWAREWTRIGWMGAGGGGVQARLHAEQSPIPEAQRYRMLGWGKHHDQEHMGSLAWRHIRAEAGDSCPRDGGPISWLSLPTISSSPPHHLV